MTIKRLLCAVMMSGAAAALTCGAAHADAGGRRSGEGQGEAAEYTEKPVFVAPGEAFDAKACAAGKKQLSIPNNSANPFLKGIIDREKKAGAEVGLQVQGMGKPGPAQPVGAGHGIRDPRQVRHRRPDLRHRSRDHRAAGQGGQGSRRQGHDVALL